jgi:hypothetical protein
MTGASNGYPGLDITARQVYVLCGLALIGCFALVVLLMRVLFWLMEHLQWVP